MEESRVMHEITPLMGKDSLYIAERRKKEFTYPIHNHEVFELNFVEHAPGVRRVVGDSSEVIGEFDLANSVLLSLFKQLSQFYFRQIFVVLHRINPLCKM